MLDSRGCIVIEGNGKGFEQETGSVLGNGFEEHGQTNAKRWRVF
jgi:hypothetical protein